MKKYTLRLLIVFLCAYSNATFCFDSICEGKTTIEADSVKKYDQHISYKGNVIVSKGAISIKGSELNIYHKNDTNISAAPLHIKEATFVIGAKENLRFGSADKVFFQPVPCILDLFSKISINTQQSTKKYHLAVRYMLDDNKISPLLEHVDQGIAAPIE